MKAPRVQRLSAPLATVLAAAALAVAIGAWLREPAHVPLPAAPTVAVAGDDNALRADLAALQQRVLAIEIATGRHEAVGAARADGTAPTTAMRDTASVQPGDASKHATTLAPATSRLLAEIEQTPFGATCDELWQQLRAAGAIDAAVEHFERVARAQPQSADAQTNLGTAYIQQLLQTPDEARRIEIGTRIDAQFDAALRLQPEHWEARFRKAVGLTYGPALSGRQDEAIAHFERLIEQQHTRTVVAHEAQSYLYLGRLYAQRGDTERARRIWQVGSSRHPQDAELSRLLAQ